MVRSTVLVITLKVNNTLFNTMKLLQRNFIKKVKKNIAHILTCK